jgi:acyl-CoA thioester hydrolase
MAESFRWQHRVSYADCTVGNHVYYSRYLDLLEEARGEFFRALGKTFLQWQTEDTAFPVLECRLKYHAPARYDELLTTEVQVMLAKGARLNFAYRVSGPAGQMLLEAETFHACTSAAERPKRLPQELIDLLAPYGTGG